MILVLQTNIAGRLSVWLVRGQHIIACENTTVEWHGSDQALQLVDRLLQKAHLTLQHLRGIVVVRGPGSFTAVRVGLIIANTLGQLRDFPLQGVVKKYPLTDSEVVSIAQIPKKRGVQILPWYGKAPNITRPPQVRAKR